MTSLLEQLFGLQGETAAVVGGAGRIGRSLCQALTSAGADVAIVDLDDAATDRLAGELRESTGRRVLSVPIDATHEDELQKAVTTITSKLAPPAMLVNAAQFRGTGFYSSNVETYPREAWDKVLETNLTAVHLACQAFGRAMVDRGGGRIVNISSTYGVVSADPRIYGSSGVNSPVAYAAAKAGVIQLTRYLAVHWRDKNIRVNCLVPGGVFDNQSAEFVANYCARTPLGRLATADDYRGPVLFMLSRASDYMTGAVVTVDGGWTAW
ncbi:MAG TPA: SDR family oxidoreductase [Pirellulales bacterium]|jgi:NAD(P)-dependent dehydrogenase (short-subunit alcohol dehydrogenase family)|nr:SDR family oxidoreductase [Pirellulales bacterium]